MNIKAIITLTCLLQLSPMAASAIIFDLGQVLMYSSRTQVLNTIGLGTLARYSLFDNPCTIEHEFLSFLEDIKAPQEEQIGWLNNTRRLPQVMYEWLNGSLRSKDIMLLVQEHARQCNKDDEHIRVITALAHAIFTPSLLAQSFVPCQEAIALVNLCKKLGHKVYILSNLDTETYECLRDLHPKFWKLFDGVLISGTVGYIKPDPRIYQFALKHFDIDPKDAVFIDDTRHNVLSAEKLGIFGIICKQYRFGLNTIPYIRHTSNAVKMWLDAQRFKKKHALNRLLHTP